MATGANIEIGIGGDLTGLRGRREGRSYAGDFAAQFAHLKELLAAYDPAATIEFIESPPPADNAEEFGVAAAAAGMPVRQFTALYVVGVWTSTLAEPIYGTKDNGRIVIDEVVGYLVTMLLVPSRSWVWLALGFVAFRAFDVIKPPPARSLQLLKGGQGVMIDDLVAGVYACASLHVLRAVAVAFDWQPLL